MFGINGGEVLVLIVLALVVVGPERLPRYAEQLGTWARALRDLARTAKERVDDELGDSVKDVDWQRLDPRQYDPRRIVREALRDGPAPVAGAASVRAGAAPALGVFAPTATGVAPYDDEAT